MSAAVSDLGLGDFLFRGMRRLGLSGASARAALVAQGIELPAWGDVLWPTGFQSWALSQVRVLSMGGDGKVRLSSQGNADVEFLVRGEHVQDFWLSRSVTESQPLRVSVDFPCIVRLTYFGGERGQEMREFRFGC